MAENEKMPHEVYNFVMDRCFDACITSFNHKLLLNSEKECLEHCAYGFKANPLVYQSTHSYQGFSTQSRGDVMMLPGMGGYKKPGQAQSTSFGGIVKM